MPTGIEVFSSSGELLFSTNTTGIMVLHTVIDAHPVVLSTANCTTAASGEYVHTIFEYNITPPAGVPTLGLNNTIAFLREIRKDPASNATPNVYPGEVVDNKVRIPFSGSIAKLPAIAESYSHSLTVVWIAS